MKNSKFTLEMRLTFFKNTLLLFLFACFSCGSQTKKDIDATTQEIQNANTTTTKVETKNTIAGSIVEAANLPETYLPLLKGKNVGVVANQTSRLDIKTMEYDKATKTESWIRVDEHLVDYLISQDINVKKVLAPEHGFRGKADAGEFVKDGIDSKTGVPLISIYGKSKKPSKEQLAGLDVIVFDIQDVGARFYTYISTLHYLMEACAEQGIPVIVLDRPNPNGNYIDGPILELEHQSFVGMHPIPTVHGMTIGEYAQMINGQKWLENGIQCELTIIPMKNYSRRNPYSLPVKPSPNLPNDKSINLYPSLCFFEGTIVSAGRGTEQQFQIFGAPSLPAAYFPYQFTPQANEGSKYPKFKGKLCNGMDLSATKNLNKINLEWLIEAYVGYGKKPDFFIPFFTNLAGTKKLQQQIEQGYTAQEIRKSWKQGLENFDKMRQAYLIYE